MQIVVALVVIWIAFALLSWLPHAVRWLLIFAIVASLLAVAAKYVRRIIG
jgi:nicotinamide riboside transporter PnuC